MSVLFVNVCRLCLPNIMSWGECLKNFTLFMLAHLHERENWRYFRCPVWKTISWYNSKPTWKLKHANSILESFEYFCQISSKSIFVILSYTVSKLMHFWDIVYILDDSKLNYWTIAEKFSSFQFVANSCCFAKIVNTKFKDVIMIASFIFILMQYRI